MKTGKSVFWFDDGKRPNVADALETALRPCLRFPPVE